MKLSLFEKIFFIVVAALLLNACASTSRVITEHPATAYIAKEADDLLARHAPIIVPQNQYKTYNKMGRPSARYDARGKGNKFMLTRPRRFFTRNRPLFKPAKGNTLI